MAFLREAVEKQKAFLIQQLVAQGVAEGNVEELYEKTMSEIVNDYEHFCKKFEESNPGLLKLTRYNPYDYEEKQYFH
ncbi:hypothetical protein GGQ92_001275 [Gracilibacillus halotolerans]|uniref:Fur-regulated basic protein FbpA n=1 Tax=Gracilibacillus halotolerans TaxID=74386 RepID=A0A841RKL2_9BACI|nr:Fur-regulated basic protein FbpA [Gracilibacillus halotolerans]MBB6512492.1 hypothetical protein [Gracilibacillus halotolerans]